jgi:hypothetical protein
VSFYISFGLQLFKIITQVLRVKQTHKHQAATQCGTQHNVEHNTFTALRLALNL